MGQLPFLKNYEGQTVEQILALRGRFRDDSLVLAIESALQEREGWFDLDNERMEPTVRSLTEPERVVMAIEAMEREVNNGGWSQFFMNSSKHFAPYLVSALHAINCHGLADLAAQAIQELRLPLEFSGEDCDRACMGLIDKIGPKLNNLDQCYYQSTDPILDRLFDYIAEHAPEIRIPHAP